MTSEALTKLTSQISATLDKLVQPERLKAVAKHLTLTPRHTKGLLVTLRGRPWDLIGIFPKISIAFQLDRPSAVDGLCAAILRDHDYPLGRRLITRMAQLGKSVEDLARETGVKRQDILRVISRRPIAEKGMREILRVLGISESEMTSLKQAEAIRQVMRTEEVVAQGHKMPLAELLDDAIRNHGGTYTDWMRMHHLKPNLMSALLCGQAIAITDDNIRKIASAIKQSEKTVRAGVRLQVPLQPMASQELMNLLNARIGKAGTAEITKESGVNNVAMRELRHHRSLATWTPSTLHSLRRYLGLPWIAFARLTEAPTSRPALTRQPTRMVTQPIEDDDELVLLRLWRKANPATKARVLEDLKENAGQVSRRP